MMLIWVITVNFFKYFLYVDLVFKVNIQLGLYLVK